MNITLSKDADKLICILYKSYLVKRTKKVPKSQAKIFGSSEDIQKNFLTNWLIEDVDETCCELEDKSLLIVNHADDMCTLNILSDEAIIYMENRFPGKVEKVIDIISKLIP